MSFKKYVRFILPAFIAVAILWYFGRGLNWQEVLTSVRSADPILLVLATSVICVGYLLRALRWRTLLAPLTTSDLSTLFETTTVGFAAVFLIGRAGEVVRPFWLPARDPRVRPTAALVTIGLERVCDLVAIVLLFALNLIWVRVPQGREAEFAYVNQAGLILLICTIFGIAALVVFQIFSRSLIDWIGRSFLAHRFVPERVRSQTLKFLNYLVSCLGILFDLREFLLTVFWTGLLWFAISIPTWLVIRAFHLPLDFSDALFVMGWAVVGSLVPTPGGAAGAFHTATAGALIFLGVSPDRAAATAIIMHFVYFAPALFFGIYYFLRGRVTLQGIRLTFGNSLDKPDQNEPDRTRTFGQGITDSVN